MATDKDNRIGYRYLFDSKGCSLSNRKELLTTLNVSGKYNATIYFGAKPRHGIHIVSGCSRYFIPGTPCALGTSEIRSEVDSSSEYGPFFLEVEVSTEADDVSSDGGTPGNHLLRQAETRRDEFRNVIHFIAGIIGLRFHRQLVLEPLNRNALAWEGALVHRGYAHPAIENLEAIPLNERCTEYLEALGGQFASLPIDWLKRYGTVFHWLLRAWHERDNAYTFIDLFVSLESLLNVVSDTRMSDEDKRHAKCIRTLIEKHACEGTEDLQRFFAKSVQRLRPTLDETFNDLAMAAKLQGWEADVEAFRKFKRMRNILVHAGDEGVQQELVVGDAEVRTLSDLVERYVNHVLFRDDNLYRSRWRPRRVPKDATEIK